MKLRKDSVWRGIFYMGAGTVFAQLINILAQPLLTRLVPAETLGIYTYVVSLSTILIPVASLKLDMLVVTEKDDNEAQYITDVCILIITALSVLYAIVILIGKIFFSNGIFNKFGFISLFAPLLVFTNGLRFLFISYNNRYKKYKLISSVAIIREFVRAVIQLGSGILSFGVVGQIMGYALSPLFGMHIQSKEYLKKLKERTRINKRKIRDIIFHSGKRQILYLVPAQFVNSFSASLITISLSYLFSSATLGYYSAGARILDIPIVFITSNVSKVMYQKASESIEKKQPLFKTVFSVTMVLSIVSFLGFGVLFIIAPHITRFVFGKGYEVSGVYIRCLCIMYAIRLVATSFAGFYTVFKKQQYELYLNIMLVVFGIVSLILSKTNDFSTTQYLWMVSIGYTVTYLIMLFGYIKLCLMYDKQMQNEVDKNV